MEALHEGLTDSFDHDPQLDIHFYISTGFARVYLAKEYLP